ncbi:MAG: trigger factor [Chloroflexi bacterium]|nr:trigger factor [Chloroflexota bacterium]
MKVTQEPEVQRQAVLTIEVDPQEVDPHLEQAARRVGQNLVVPGFRKGKAPRWMVERVLGRDALLDEALDSLLQGMTRKALEQEKLESSAPPKVEVVQRDPFIFKATVPLTPKVEIGDYASIRVPFPSVEVQEQQVAEALEALRRETAPWEPQQRPVELNDLVVIDLKGSVEGRAYFAQNDLSYIVAEDSEIPLPGFAAKLVGAEAGVSRELTLAIPETYPDRSVAGKDCAFSVLVKEVKAQRLPALDDEFAKGVEQGFESLDALRDDLRRKLLEGERELARRRYEEQVIEAAVKVSQMEVPPLLTEHEVDHALADQAALLARSRIRWEDYLRQVGKAEEDLRKELEPRVAERLTGSLVLRKIAELEEIQVTEEEIDQELKEARHRAGSESEERGTSNRDAGDRMVVSSVLRTRKTVARLVAIAQAPAPEKSQGTAEAENREVEATPAEPRTTASS